MKDTDKNIILCLRLGVGFPTKPEAEAIQEITNSEHLELIGEDEPIACGSVLSGPNIPIPGINKDGHMMSILETEYSAEECAEIFSKADDFLPVLCIDITDKINTNEIAINAQMASEGLGGMMEEILDIEPVGEFDEEQEVADQKRRQKEGKAKRKEIEAKMGHDEDADDDDCDCPACQLRSMLKDKFESEDGIVSGKVDGIDGLKDLLGKLKDMSEGGGRPSKKKKSSSKKKEKSCDLSMNQLLDLIQEKGGVEALSEVQVERLKYLSENPE